MTNETLLLLILIVLLLGALPAWPYSSSWGYGPGGLLGVILVIFLIWAVASGRPLLRSGAHSTSSDAKATAQDIGEGLKDAGRSAADSIRNLAR